MYKVEKKWVSSWYVATYLFFFSLQIVDINFCFLLYFWVVIVIKNISTSLRLVLDYSYIYYIFVNIWRSFLVINIKIIGHQLDSYALAKPEYEFSRVYINMHMYGTLNSLLFIVFFLPWHEWFLYKYSLA